MQNDVMLAPEAGKLVWLYDLGVRFMVSGAQTDGRFALVEHPIRPKALAAPLHTHADEDEISYVLEGALGMQIGDRELRAGPVTLVFKPRGIPHAFWNPGDAPARMLELISPAGFERYFEEAADLMPADRAMPNWPPNCGDGIGWIWTSQASRAYFKSTDWLAADEPNYTDGGRPNTGASQVGTANTPPLVQ